MWARCNWRIIVVVVKFGNNKKSIDNQGECLVDQGKLKFFEEVVTRAYGHICMDLQRPKGYTSRIGINIKPSTKLIPIML
jgi:hypothetical protein